MMFLIYSNVNKMQFHSLTVIHVEKNPSDHQEITSCSVPATKMLIGISVFIVQMCTQGYLMSHSSNIVLLFLNFSFFGS